MRTDDLPIGQLIAELRDLTAALAAYDDQAFCYRLVLAIESRRRELQHRKRDEAGV